jgi:hypothetical protein
MWDSANLNLRPIGLARFWGIELRNPTSREKRARYGAPEFVEGRIPESLFPRTLF